MDPTTFDEIISTLAKCGRPDLIEEFREHVKIDSDYKPPKFVKRDSLSVSEGSADEESDYDYKIDEDGFHSLK